MIIEVYDVFRGDSPFDEHVGLFRDAAKAKKVGEVYARHAIEVDGKVYLLQNSNPVTFKDEV